VLVVTSKIWRHCDFTLARNSVDYRAMLPTLQVPVSIQNLERWAASASVVTDARTWVHKKTDPLSTHVWSTPPTCLVFLPRIRQPDSQTCAPQFLNLDQT